MKTYYKLPISAKTVVDMKKAPTVNLEESIHQMISLICTTSYREYFEDHNFGSVIWEMDFENIHNSHIVKREMKLALAESIKKYEKRAKLVTIQIKLKQFDFNHYGRKVKTRLTMAFQMKLYSTGKMINHIEEFFIGPLSYFWRNN